MMLLSPDEKKMGNGEEVVKSSLILVMMMNICTWIWICLLLNKTSFLLSLVNVKNNITKQ